MKLHRSVVLLLLVGLVLIAFAISIAQTSRQSSNQKKQADSCCAMDAHGASCDMKEGKKTDSAKHCCGDSCDMKTKHDARNHASEAGCCCCGDSCDMEKHDAKNASANYDCCAGQTARNTTAKHDMKNMKNMNHDMKNACCCCSDSCEMKPNQSGF